MNSVFRMHVCVSCLNVALGEIPLCTAEVLSVTITPDINITANLTNMIEISCVLDCSCVGTLLNWTRDGGDLPSSAVISYSETRRTVYLRISSVQDDAIGTYICTATNAILGTVMERIDLIVLDTDGQCWEQLANRLQQYTSMV